MLNKVQCSKLFLPVIFLLLFVNNNAQDTASRILKSLQDKFGTISDLSANVVHVSMGQTLSGKLLFKKENNFHLDFKNNIIVSNGVHIWNYSKKDNKVIISDFDDSDPSSISINKIIYDYPSESNIKSETDVEGDVLILVPKENSELNFTLVKIWVNKENLISKVKINSGSGETEIRFSNYKLNRNLADSQFTFTPPEGSTVIDLR
jgi:outer membrane lipoprotein-sorting protein